RYLYSFFYTLFLLLRLNPKLIVVHWASRLYQNILLALWGHRVIVHTMGGEINPEEDCYGKKKIFTGILFRCAKIITGKTEVMHKILLQNFPFVSPNKLKIISFGVEERFFIRYSIQEHQEMQREFFGQSFETLFFSIRTFKPIHFHREIIDSFLKLYACNPKIALLISTQSLDKAYLAQCEQEFALQSQKNIFLRNIPHETMHHILGAVDCVISYKLCDGISQSLMESVAANRFVIANRLENHAMLLQHHHNAYLVDNLNELPQAMQYAQAHKAQPYAIAFLDREQQKSAYLQILHQYYGIIVMTQAPNNMHGGGNLDSC
ncbi:MAG: hypothetical protein K2O85_02425, partial [Helicobacter sp.]|nr:hypothetical protein [Helicobacter sp.]